MNRLFARTFVVIAAFAALAGCNATSSRGPVSMSAWQTQVQSYVANEGNGDMTALRNVEVAPAQAISGASAQAQPGFRIFSSDRPEQSKDVVGMLVGAHTLGDDLWYVYIVAELDKEQVVAMRLAAVSLSGAQFSWRIGSDEAGGKNAYIAFLQQQWTSQHAGETPAPRNALGFPNASDRFTMQASGESITVREGASGATWTLSLAAAKT